MVSRRRGDHCRAGVAPRASAAAPRPTGRTANPRPRRRVPDYIHRYINDHGRSGTQEQADPVLLRVSADDIVPLVPTRLNDVVIEGCDGFWFEHVIAQNLRRGHYISRRSGHTDPG